MCRHVHVHACNTCTVKSNVGMAKLKYICTTTKRNASRNSVTIIAHASKSCYNLKNFQSMTKEYNTLQGCI